MPNKIGAPKGSMRNVLIQPLNEKKKLHKKIISTLQIVKECELADELTPFP